MEKLRYWNFLGEVFELEEAWVKCLDLEERAARLLTRLRGRPSDGADVAELTADLRGFLSGLSRELRSVTPRPPAWPIDWLEPGRPDSARPRMGRFPGGREERSDEASSRL